MQKRMATPLSVLEAKIEKKHDEEATEQEVHELFDKMPELDMQIAAAVQSVGAVKKSAEVDANVLDAQFHSLIVDWVDNDYKSEKFEPPVCLARIDWKKHKQKETFPCALSNNPSFTSHALDKIYFTSSIDKKSQATRGGSASLSQSTVPNPVKMVNDLLQRASAMSRKVNGNKLKNVDLELSAYDDQSMDPNIKNFSIRFPDDKSLFFPVEKEKRVSLEPAYYMGVTLCVDKNFIELVSVEVHPIFVGENVDAYYMFLGCESNSMETLSTNNDSLRLHSSNYFNNEQTRVLLVTTNGMKCDSGCFKKRVNAYKIFGDVVFDLCAFVFRKIDTSWFVKNGNLEKVNDWKLDSISSCYISYYNVDVCSTIGEICLKHEYF